MLRVVAMAATLAVFTDVGAALAQNAERGDRLFKRICASCHVLEPGIHRVGPSLHGVWGREAGSADGYEYTEALVNSGVVWSAETIDQQLAAPKDFIPGNRMGVVFPRGVRKPEDRADIIAYMETATAVTN